MHTALVAALVDFHKIQCFFASTIQITALIFFQESQSSSAQDITAVRSSFRDFFDTSVLIVLATSGFIPIVFTLACISRYGRQSWYLIVLSLVTILLATATLACSYIYARDYGIPRDVYFSNMQNLYLYNDNNYNNVSTVSTTCNIKGNVGQSIFPLCGSSNLEHNTTSPGTVANRWILAAWVNCILWFLVCIAQHCYNSHHSTYRSYHQCLSDISARYPWFKVLSRVFFKRSLWTIIFLLAWSFCFGFQFYLFSAYFEHAIISKQWSFGQIIAVTVWIPSLVEYIYMEYSESEWSLDPQMGQSLNIIRWT